MNKQHRITHLLKQWEKGDSEAIDRLFPLVYDKLHQMAHNRLLHERANHTLSTTGLVNEAYFELVNQEKTDWKDRAHFLAFASLAMRRVLVAWARKQNAQKRSGQKEVITFNENLISVEAKAAELLDLDSALNRLADRKERLSKVVECRFFGGLTEKETAAALDVSTRTIRRDWTVARAWLYKELSPESI